MLTSKIMSVIFYETIENSPLRWLLGTHVKSSTHSLSFKDVCSAVYDSVRRGRQSLQFHQVLGGDNPLPGKRSCSSIMILYCF